MRIAGKERQEPKERSPKIVTTIALIDTWRETGMSPFICVVQFPLFRTMYIVYQLAQFSLLLKQFRLFLHELIKNGIGTKTHSTQLFINRCGTGKGKLHRSRLYHCPIKKLKLPVSQYTTQKYFIRGMVLG